MAFTVTQRASNNNTTTASQTQVSSSFTPTASSRLFVFAFAERNFHAGTQNWGISNTGSLSFTLLDTSTIYSWNGDTLYAANCVGWYADVGGSPSSMTVTVDADAVATDSYFYSLVVFDVTGYDTGTPFAQASVDNGAQLTGGDSHSGTLTLGSAPTSGNLVVAMFGSSQDTGGGFATPTGYTVLTNQSVGGYTGAAVFYHTSTTTAAVTCSDLGNTVGNWGGIIFEMTAEAGATPASDSTTSYLKGSSSSTDSTPSYLKGFSSSSDSTASYLEGTLTITSTQTAYLLSGDQASGNQPSYLDSFDQTLDSQPSFLEGFLTSLDSQNVYLSGALTSNDSVPSYMEGIGTVTDSIGSYLRGEPVHINATVNGVLTVNATNTRYLDNDNGVVFLAGFHTWYSSQDGGSSDPPTVFDYDAYLDYLDARGANLHKLWFMETAYDWPDVSPQYYTPHPWARTGPGNALDGKLKFDLTEFNQTYFDRLRERALLAGNRGHYVIIQLFQGWQIDQKGMATGDPWAYHPFEDGNNINGINGDPGGDGVGDEIRDVTNTTVYNLQKDYVDKVLETLNDLDHIIYEISNEDGTYSQTWQSALVDYIHTQEASLPKQHLVGLTKIWPSGTNTMLEKNNEWLSYDSSGADAVADGTYVSIYDTDHTVGLTSNYEWVWESLCNGHYPLYMDEYDGEIYGTDRTSTPAYERIRYNTGYIHSFIIPHIDLETSIPTPSLSTNNLCLADTTNDTYVSFQFNGSSFDLDLSGVSGILSVDWLRTLNGTTQAGSNVTGGDANETFTPPWSDGSVLLLKMTGAISSKTAYLKGYNTATDSTPSYLRGSNPSTGSITSYLDGFDVSIDSTTSYLEGFENSLDNQNAYLDAFEVAQSLVNSYLNANDIALSNKDSYLSGFDSSSATINGYLEAFDVSLDNLIAYLEGAQISNDSLTAFLEAFDLANEVKSSFLEGFEISTDSIASYLTAIGLVSDAVSAYMVSGNPISDNQSSYLDAFAENLTNIESYLRGYLETFDNKPSYLSGVSGLVSNIFSFLKGFSSNFDNISGYLKGFSTNISSINSYLNGTLETIGNIGSYLKGSDVSLSSKNAYMFSGSSSISNQGAYLNAVSTARLTRMVITFKKWSSTWNLD